MCLMLNSMATESTKRHEECKKRRRSQFVRLTVFVAFRAFYGSAWPVFSRRDQ